MEQWRDIAGYKNYQVSNLGRVRSIVSNRSYRQRVLKPCCRKADAYLQVTLYRPGRKRKQAYVHILVAKAFVSNPKGKPEVNHKDLNKGNCVATNLEWATQEENITHAEDGGRKLNGAYRKLDKKLADEIRSKYIPRTITLKMLASEYGVSDQMIHRIVTGKNWRR